MIAWFVAAGAAVVALVAVAVASHARQRAVEARALADRRGAELADMERELSRNAQLEGQLAQALDAMSIGVILCRADGTVVFRNEAAENFVAARHGRALVESAAQEALRAALGGETVERPVELFGPPLTSFVVRAVPLVSTVDDICGPIGALALVEDATERHRVDQVRRDFVANISHELRTPIGAIGLLAETLHDEVDLETIIRLSGRIVGEVDRVAATIEDLLELSRIEFGDETHIDELPVRVIIDEAVARLRAASEQHGVDVMVSGSSSPVVRGDRRQLTSAVFNLIDNAVKFSAPGTTVLVEVAAPDDETVSIAVTDHGVGIPLRDLDRVFERFYRVDRARSRGTGGTGLGLAIVRHVASNHGGEISVSSTEGKGSVFSLVLPVHNRALRRPTGGVLGHDRVGVIS